MSPRRGALSAARRRRAASRARDGVANGPSVPAAFGAGRVPDQESLPRSETWNVAEAGASAARACIAGVGPARRGARRTRRAGSIARGRTWRLLRFRLARAASACSRIVKQYPSGVGSSQRAGRWRREAVDAREARLAALVLAAPSAMLGEVRLVAPDAGPRRPAPSGRASPGWSCSGPARGRRSGSPSAGR